MDRLRRLWFVPLGVAVVALVALVPVLRARGLQPGEARVDVDGRARIIPAGGTARFLTGRATLHPGDRFEQLTGTARFELSGGAGLESRTGHAGTRPGTVLLMAATPRLLAGELLVTTPRSLRLDAGDAVVDLRAAGGRTAAARASRAGGLQVGVYAGRARVDSEGAGRDLFALRRVEVAAPGDVSQRPSPLRYRTTDRWDRRFLADAMTLDGQLAPILDGYAASGGPDPRDPDQLRRVIDGLPPAGTLRPLVAPARPQGDVLVAAAIARLATDPGGFTRAWKRATAFYDDGATWGLVALDRGVAPRALLALLARSLDRTPFAFDVLADAVRALPGESAASLPGAGGGLDGAPAGAVVVPGDPGRGEPGDGAGPGGGTGNGNGGGGTGNGGTGGGAGGGGVTVPGTTLPGGGTVPGGGGLTTTLPGGITVPGAGRTTILPPITTPSTLLPPITTPTTLLPPVTRPRVTTTVPLTLPTLPTLPVTTTSITLPR